MNAFIRDLEETRSVTKSCDNLNTSAEEFDNWISRDKCDIEPYASFQKVIHNIIWSEDNDILIRSWY